MLTDMEVRSRSTVERQLRASLSCYEKDIFSSACILLGRAAPSGVKSNSEPCCMQAIWKTILQGAIDEALLAVDLYNEPRQARRLEGFFVHMHIAWLYVLQARFKRDQIDFRYRLPNGRFDRIDGEPKTWDLQKCVLERYPDDGPIRKNLEFTIGLRPAWARANALIPVCLGMSTRPVSQVARASTSRPQENRKRRIPTGRVASQISLSHMGALPFSQVSEQVGDSFARGGHGFKSRQLHHRFCYVL